MRAVTGRIKGSKLTVVRYYGRDSGGKKIYVFRCECGKEKPIRYDHVANGKCKSCGCLQKQTRSSENMDRIRKIPRDPEKWERYKEKLRNRPGHNKGKIRIEEPPGSKKYKYVTERELTEIYYGVG